MSTINVTINDHAAEFTNMPIISSGSINVDKIQFTFDDTWDNFTGRVCVFYKQRGQYWYGNINSSGIVNIPAGVMSIEGTITLGVSGYYNGAIKTTEVLSYNVYEGTYTDVNDEDYETFEEIKNQMLAIQAQIESAADEVLVQIEDLSDEVTSLVNDKIVEQLVPINEFLGIDTIQIPTYTTTNQYMSHDDHIPKPSSENKLTSAIPVTAGMTVAYKCRCSSGISCLSFATTSNASTWTELIEGQTIGATRDYSAEIENDGYIRITYLSSGGLSDLKLTKASSGGGLSSDVQNLTSDLSNVNYFLGLPFASTPPAYTTTNQYMSHDDHIPKPSLENKLTSAIPVAAGTVISYKCKCNTGISCLSFAATSNASTWAELLEGQTTTQMKEYSYLVENDGYIRITYYIHTGDGLTDFRFITNADAEGMYKDVQTIKGQLADSNNLVLRPIRGSEMKNFGTQPAADGSSGSFCNLNLGYNDLLTSVFEPLRTANTNYITRTNMGKDASNSIDMYVYTFEPKFYQQHVILDAGVHPTERASIAALARIMQLITDNPDDDPDIEFLRQNIKFTIIPIVNVWGFSQSPKVHYNVNNQEFQTWTSNPLNPELTNIKNYLSSVEHNFAFGLDMHCSGSGYPDFYASVTRDSKSNRTIFRTQGWMYDNLAVNAPKHNVVDVYSSTAPEYWRTYMSTFLNIEYTTLEFNQSVFGSISSNAVSKAVDFYLNHIIQQVNDGYRLITNIPTDGIDWNRHLA